jgi:secondary thiamine-phosphate synthase enzyme
VVSQATRGAVRTDELTIHTGRRRGVFDITPECAEFVAGEGDGLLSVFVPHATAGLIVMETGSGSDDDLVEVLDRLLPRDERAYRHRHGSPGHGADHLVSMVASPSLTVPVIGTWQSICMLDPNADNASRSVRLSFLAG